jgi:hypothetical protein
MRMLMRVQMDTDAANPIVADGTLQKTLKEAFEQLKPEAAYFALQDGCRGAYIVFDMKDPSQIPAIVEPMFQGPHAKLDVTPVMNLEDLQKGLAEASRHH